MLVKELLRADGNGWDEVKVRNALLAFEADAVLSIPISHRHPRDDWCWDLENNGVYSVKSAYRAIFGGNEPENAASSSRGDGWIWSKIWKVPIIPRVKMFFWQLCNMALPTKERLRGRTGLGDEVCPMCAGEEETDIHVMRDCRVARMTWAMGDMEVRLEVEGGNIQEWVEGVWAGLGEEEKTEFMVQCWALWWARNQTVFEGERVDPYIAWEKGRYLLAETVGAKEHSGGILVSRCGSEVKWERPEVGMVKINTDAVVKEGQGTGLGVVARDELGAVLWCLTEQDRNVLEVKVAEAQAVLIGMREASRQGMKKVIIEADCQVLIEAIRRRETGRSSFHLLLDDIFDLNNCFEVVVWSHIGRKRNNVAHELAHVRPWIVGRRFWLLTTPPQVTKFVILDSQLMES